MEVNTLQLEGIRAPGGSPSTPAAKEAGDPANSITNPLGYDKREPPAPAGQQIQDGEEGER